jgi:ketosteroid isomerase-like protein
MQSSTGRQGKAGRTFAAGAAILALAALGGAAAARAQDAPAVDPDHYKVVFENDQVRVLRITYGPHEKSVMHSHPQGVAIYMDDLKGQFTLPDGSVVDSGGKARSVFWTEGGAHQPENLADTPFEVIQIEMKGPGAEDEATIRASAPAWAAAFNAQDADTLAGMYWDDSLLFPPNVPAVAGGAPMHEYFARETPAFKAAGLTMNIPEAGKLDIAGNLAYEAGTYTITDASGAVVDAGKYIGVFEQRDGVWRYIRDTWNSDLAPAPAAE